MLGSIQALSASEIGKIIAASPLPNDEIERLIDQLLDKMATNTEVSAHPSHHNINMATLINPRFLCFFRPAGEQVVLEVSRSLMMTPSHSTKTIRQR